jgi:hypothetical protein
VRLALLLAALLCGCGSFATTGEQGPKGDPGADGAQGPIGPEGPPGSGGCVDGPRLKCVRAIGSDGSSVAVPMMFDSAEDDPDGRDEYCTWQLREGVDVCLPPQLPATEFLGYVHAGCSPTDDRVHERSFATASYPYGTSRVLTISANPDANNRPLVRSGPMLSSYWIMSNNGQGPCVEIGAADGPIQNPFPWTVEYTVDAFVHGELAP